ncbi:hypothetical protein Vadar_033625 [Vaccinium darrowii]|uniref:Uncharacterized protein n=1 Tax=Vaccinium darrowii TaxID=229202 RepID=A0ACB7X6N0_9ERIC|nr:hypothetical protein Vadar_033625 [Vaccinium darrowii]
MQAGFQMKDRWSVNAKDIHDRALERVTKRNGPNITDFRTLWNPLMKILNWLRNGYKVKGIGIHGIPRIGKTTIISNLNDHNQFAKMFVIVIWFKVLEGNGNNSIKKLQQAIARRLDLTKKTRNPGEVAQSISAVLERMRYLRLLDDVNKLSNYVKLGILIEKTATR